MTVNSNPVLPHNYPPSHLKPPPYNVSQANGTAATAVPISMASFAPDLPPFANMYDLQQPAPAPARLVYTPQHQQVPAHLSVPEQQVVSTRVGQFGTQTPVSMLPPPSAPMQQHFHLPEHTYANLMFSEQYVPTLMPPQQQQPIATTAAAVNFFLPPTAAAASYQPQVTGPQLLEPAAAAAEAQHPQQLLLRPASHTPYLSSSSEMSGGYSSDMNAYSDGGALTESQLSGAYQQLAAHSLPPPFNLHTHSPPRATPSALLSASVGSP